MPRIRLTKSAIDALPTRASDVVYWDAGRPGFGVTPKGRKVFIVLYRTGGGGSKLRKYTIGPYGRVTLHQGHPLRRHTGPGGGWSERGIRMSERSRAGRRTGSGSRRSRTSQSCRGRRSPRAFGGMLINTFKV
jgi:hypothetical protein